MGINEHILYDGYLDIRAHVARVAKIDKLGYRTSITKKGLFLVLRIDIYNGPCQLLLDHLIGMVTKLWLDSGIYGRVTPSYDNGVDVLIASAIPRPENQSLLIIS